MVPLLRNSLQIHETVLADDKPVNAGSFEQPIPVG